MVISENEQGEGFVYMWTAGLAFQMKDWSTIIPDYVEKDSCLKDPLWQGNSAVC